MGRNRLCGFPRWSNGGGRERQDDGIVDGRRCVLISNGVCRDRNRHELGRDHDSSKHHQ